MELMLNPRGCRGIHCAIFSTGFAMRMIGDVQQFFIANDVKNAGGGAITRILVNPELMTWARGRAGRESLALAGQWHSGAPTLREETHE